MCNMLKRHAFIFTRTKPWTTVDGSIATLTIPELCMMCDVHLIYLGNNKYYEIKCKPEVLSPLPRPIPFKRESSSIQQQLEHSTLSPTQEVVVGILDASQSSCTLVSLPSSPQMNQIEMAKKEIAMKDSGETVRETSETQPVETDTNNSMDMSLNAPEATPSLDPNTSASQPIKDDQCKVDQARIADTYSMDEPSCMEGQVKNMVVETAPKTVEMVVMETGEEGNNNNKTKATVATSNSEINEFETEGEIKDSVSSAYPSLPAPPVKPMTPPPQLPQNKPLLKQPETVVETKRSQVTVETKLCTVRLEILMQANIVKHVHVHRETAAHTMTPPPVETVEMPKDFHFKRSHAKPKPDRTTRHPGIANQYVDYSNLETAEEDSQSPTPKHQWFSRPRRGPSSSRIKTDSFTTKQPAVRPLRRSSMLTTSPDTSEHTSVTNTTPAKPVPKLSTPSTSTDVASKGTFKTQSYGLKKSKKAHRFSC